MKRFIGRFLFILSKVKLYKRPYWSTGICGRLTCGYGELSDNGYWEFPVKEEE